MPRSYKPAKASQAMAQRIGTCHQSSDEQRCPKSPSGGHWWIIDPPGGAISNGVCRYCGEHRPFANTMDESLRGRRGNK